MKFKKSLYLLFCLIVLVNSSILLNALFFDMLPKVINTAIFYFVFPIGLAAILRKLMASKSESITFLLIIPSLLLWLPMMVDHSWVGLNNWLSPPILLEVSSQNDLFELDDAEGYFAKVKAKLNEKCEVKEHQYTSTKKGTDKVETIYNYLQGMQITHDGLWLTQSESSLGDKEPKFGLKRKGTLYGIQSNDPYYLDNFEPIYGKSYKAVFKLVEDNYAAYLSKNRSSSLMFLLLVNCILVIFPIGLYSYSSAKRKEPMVN
ncbi:MAG: hypothetical protein AB8B56_13690 [Crocinitomicaceae bacterium]